MQGKERGPIQLCCSVSRKLGVSHAAHGRYLEARRAFETALELSRRAGNKAQEGLFLRDLADHAIACCLRALELAARGEGPGRTMTIMGVHMELGVACHSAGRHQEALSAFREALAIARELGHTDAEELCSRGVQVCEQEMRSLGG